MEELNVIEPAAKLPPLYETSCKDCCFATYDGKTQMGCQFDRIEKFRNQGIEVVEVHDDEAEFYLIKSACLLHRHKKSPWAMQTPGRLRRETARREIALVFDAVIFMGEDHSVEQVKATVDSMLTQKHQPRKVRVVVNRDDIIPMDIRTLLPDQWEVQFVMERREGQRVSRGRCIDIAVVESKSHFYAVFDAGTIVPESFFSSIDHAINDNLDRFVLLEPDNKYGNGMVVMTRSHEYFGGNKEAIIESDDAGAEAGLRADSIADKICHRARVENLPHLIKKVSEICPNLA